MAEDRCDFLFSTGEFTERDVRDDWSGLFDLVENHVDEDGGEEESKFRETNASESITAGTAVSGVSGSSRRRDSSSSVGSGRETVRAEDLLHNDKETEDDREGEVEEPLGGGGGTAMQALGGGGRAVPKNWESEEKRISTHSRHHRRRRQKKHRYTQ